MKFLCRVKPENIWITEKLSQHTHTQLFRPITGSALFSPTWNSSWQLQDSGVTCIYYWFSVPQRMESRYLKGNSLLDLFQEELIRNPLGEWIILTRTRNPVPKLNVQSIHIALYLDTFTLTCNVDELQILTSRFAMLSPASAHPYRPEVCTYNFSCLPEQSPDTKEPRQGFLGPKSTWSLAFWGNLYYNPFSTCPLHHDRKGKQETPKAGTSTGQRDFLLGLNLLCTIKGDWNHPNEP